VVRLNEAESYDKAEFEGAGFRFKFTLSVVFSENFEEIKGRG
jgi:hypothetical protein